MKLIKICISINIVLFFMSLISCGGGSGSDNKTSSQIEERFEVSGIVKDFFTGDVIEGISIKLVANENGQAIESDSYTTGVDGTFKITYANPIDRFTVTGEGAGYGEYSVVYTNSDSNSDSKNEFDAGEIFFLKNHVSQVINYDSGGDVTYEDITLVSIPPGGVVTVDGEIPVGNINVSVTIIDPSIDPSLMPGNYQTINSETGGVKYIEPFGVISVSMRDEEGNILNLDDDSKATIRIPLAHDVPNIYAYRRLSLYYFDEISGYWVEEGEAVFEELDYGWSVYTGEVSQLKVWSVGKAYNSLNILGCVEDQFGNPVSDAIINSSGVDYIGSSVAMSDSNGQFIIPVKYYSDTLLSAQSVTAGISGSQVVSSDVMTKEMSISDCMVLNQETVSIKLTWGQHPYDLDAHLWGSYADGGGFHLFFDEPTILVENTVISLDLEHSYMYGPEIITIPSFPLPGTYKYCVSHYAGHETILDSRAKVTLNIGNEQMVFSSSDAVGSFQGMWDLWCVFSFEVGDDLKPKVIVDQSVEYYNYYD